MAFGGRLVTVTSTAADASSAFATRLRSALVTAPAMPLDAELVESCAHSGAEPAALAEAQFLTAFRGSLADVPRSQRAPGLNGVTGHVAESVVESMLADLGWVPLEHFTGPFSGGHGIDLAMATPDLEGVYAIEAKGTLAARGWPRLRAGDIPQLTPEWLAKADNPGVESLGLEPAGLGIIAVLVHFGRRQWKAVKSNDLDTVAVVEDGSDLLL